jgi:tRNA1(Val) A37 N6-methylase TrmN6
MAKILRSWLKIPFTSFKVIIATPPFFSDLYKWFEAQITRVEAASFLSFFPLALYVNFTKKKKKTQGRFSSTSRFLV